MRMMKLRGYKVLKRIGENMLINSDEICTIEDNMPDGTRITLSNGSAIVIVGFELSYLQDFFNGNEKAV